MLRCAKDLKLKARAVESWAGLMKLPLRAIVELRKQRRIIEHHRKDFGTS
jgi:hypothetical protein